MVVIRRLPRAKDLLGQPVPIEVEKSNGLVRVINDFAKGNAELKHAFWAWVKSINNNRPNFRCSHIWAIPQVRFLQQTTAAEQLVIINKMADTACLTCRYEIDRRLQNKKGQSFKIGSNIEFRKNTKRRYEDE